RGAARLPRRHDAGLPESLLSVRPRDQRRARRQHHLQLGVPDALHHGLHRRTARKRSEGHGAAPRGVRRVQSPALCRARNPRVVAPRREQLVSQPRRAGRDHLALAAGRLLELDAPAEARGIPPHLSPERRRAIALWRSDAGRRSYSYTKPAVSPPSTVKAPPVL